MFNSNSSDEVSKEKELCALLRFFSLFTERNSINDIADPQIPLALFEMLNQVYANNISLINDIV